MIFNPRQSLAVPPGCLTAPQAAEGLSGAAPGDDQGRPRRRAEGALPGRGCRGSPGGEVKPKCAAWRAGKEASPRPRRPPRPCPPRRCPTGCPGGRRKRRGARGRGRRGAAGRRTGASRSPRPAAAGARSGMRGNGSGRRRSSSRSSSTWSPCKERRRGGCPGGARPARSALGARFQCWVVCVGGVVVFILSLSPRKAGVCSLPTAAAAAPSRLETMTHFYT